LAGETAATKSGLSAHSTLNLWYACSRLSNCVSRTAGSFQSASLRVLICPTVMSSRRNTATVAALSCTGHVQVALAGGMSIAAGDTNDGGAAAGARAMLRAIRVPVTTAVALPPMSRPRRRRIRRPWVIACSTGSPGGGRGSSSRARSNRPCRFCCTVRAPGCVVATALDDCLGVRIGHMIPAAAIMRSP
jgi:hypothetical protein